MDLIRGITGYLKSFIRRLVREEFQTNQVDNSAKISANMDPNQMSVKVPLLYQ
jgi:hypothetical protein